MTDTILAAGNALLQTAPYLVVSIAIAIWALARRPVFALLINLSPFGAFAARMLCHLRTAMAGRGPKAGGDLTAVLLSDGGTPAQLRSPARRSLSRSTGALFVRFSAKSQRNNGHVQAEMQGT